MGSSLTSAAAAAAAAASAATVASSATADVDADATDALDEVREALEDERAQRNALEAELEGTRERLASAEEAAEKAGKDVSKLTNEVRALERELSEITASKEAAEKRADEAETALAARSPPSSPRAAAAAAEPPPAASFQAAEDARRAAANAETELSNARGLLAAMTLRAEKAEAAANDANAKAESAESLLTQVESAAEKVARARTPRRAIVVRRARRVITGRFLETTRDCDRFRASALSRDLPSAAATARVPRLGAPRARRSRDRASSVRGLWRGRRRERQLPRRVFLARKAGPALEESSGPAVASNLNSNYEGEKNPAHSSRARRRPTPDPTMSFDGHPRERRRRRVLAPRRDPRDRISLAAVSKVWRDAEKSDASLPGTPRALCELGRKRLYRRTWRSEGDLLVA